MHFTHSKGAICLTEVTLIWLMSFMSWPIPRSLSHGWNLVSFKLNVVEYFNPPSNFRQILTKMTKRGKFKYIWESALIFLLRNGVMIMILVSLILLIGNENFTKKGLKRKETMENRFATFNPLYFPTYPNMKDFMVRTFRRNCSLIENYDDYYVGLRHYGHTFCQDNTSHYLGIERVTCDLMAESKLSYETYLMTLVLIRWI